VPVLKQLTSLPVVVDPSHATGRADLVGAVARAGVAAGADGLLVEVHPNPMEALSDGAQSLSPAAFRTLVTEVGGIASVIGRTAG
jgi:3-deoxy-7-phosphoheptulonate synthase